MEKSKPFVSIIFGIFTILIIVLVLNFIWRFKELKAGRIWKPDFEFSNLGEQVMSGSNCERLSNLPDQNICFVSQANLEKNYKICEKIIVSDLDPTSSYNKGLCYGNVARTLNDVSICDNTSLSYKKICIENMGR
ncbi:hypothetical protein A2422_03440 [Candidatus Woesebacteria bacterium RIFOXYC1_FULL_31_51]|uniref:Transmembrane protein n=1 Tax=Candidatus Woesebacteria bacterium GW2011_GWC2_31_9 TaxID=1618586 RepID=A0A0G0BM45_9BACT|nr:MAG: hypothetical protein UR17_C0001G0195 [Candidatus Woesebacteria bacterium GW2011_GWF1_31_35]KKP23309.1 MAG: hypothetical protein UR11_C0001G0283 [Candidatus Woesebacteria bacterium GW2011_GWC1_30_29]KKP26173.1 MAG: hypothetical protein UR13_C0005G0056 [Candidatus Woesebacteria bacterium GW2011_GWD1_31_12]KKP27570.1 MAG: hypothetical protein UR16_C0003G0230 [Candidatus Woesebacteria bacterium GW2011_GWB1_31_29]KKP31639.1 MAG: hypothetical protein UR20_C0034G0002 [Candidatus Woesebacteria 